MNPETSTPNDSLDPLEIITLGTFLDFLGRFENEFRRREEFWRNSTQEHALGAMIATADCADVIKTITQELIEGRVK